MYLKASNLLVCFEKPKILSQMSPDIYNIHKASDDFHQAKILQNNSANKQASLSYQKYVHIYEVASENLHKIFYRKP